MARIPAITLGHRHVCRPVPRMPLVGHLAVRLGALASPRPAGGAADALVGLVVIGEFGEVPGVAVLAQGAGGCCRLVTTQPRKPMADLRLRTWTVTVRERSLAQ